MRLRLLPLLLALLPISMQAYEEQFTVRTDTVGQLATFLPDSIRYTMSELKVCGPLNGNDLRILKLITQHTIAKNENERVLTTLDLSEVELSESKGNFRSSSETLPAAMFVNSKAIQKVILP